jgi:hypothetical protein
MEDFIKHLNGCKTCIENVSELIFTDKLTLTAGEKDRIGKKIERLIFIDLLSSMIGKSTSSENLYKTISSTSLFRIYNFIYSNIVPKAGFHRLIVIYKTSGLIITEDDMIRFPYAKEEYMAILDKLNTENASIGVALAGAAAAKDMEAPAPSTFKLYFQKKRIIFAVAASVVLLLIASLLVYNYFGMGYTDNTVIARGGVDRDFNMFIARHYENNIGISSQTKGYSHDGKRISDYDKMTKTLQRMSSVIGDLYLSLDLIVEGASPDDNRRSIIELVKEMKYIITSSERFRAGSRLLQ